MFSTLWLSSGSTWHWLALALLWHAARLKDICGPVETGATGGKMLPTLDPMRAVICCISRSSRAFASLVKIWCILFSLPSNSRLIALRASLSLCSSIGTAPVIADIRLVFGTGDDEIDGKDEATRIDSSKSSIFALSSSDCLCAAQVLSYLSLAGPGRLVVPAAPWPGVPLPRLLV